MYYAQLNGIFCSMAKCRRTDVQDEESKGQSSVVTDETKGKIEVIVQEDRYDCQSCYANS